ncbi:peroxidasin [Neodiprion virginianus]|uniref:peroxidasin n=1 Tax=Neodiprion virginianus TaxID=2961670 RepID=UPI001EE6EB4C|nr:peroxidasin [Neodiprion virginianus]
MPAKIVLVIILAVLAGICECDGLQSYTDSINECPSKCVCYRKTVRCTFQKLNRLPSTPPTDTGVLDLRFNNIVEIDPRVFRGLNELHTLLLNDNQIRYVPAKAFSDLPNLRKLYLYKNRIASIEPDSFNGLVKLEQLYLHNNYLTEIKDGTFNNLAKLERLFLQNNKIAHLPADAFRNVGPMTRLRLDSNSLVCDCDLMWLVQRLQDKPGEMAAVCDSPNNMRGRSLIGMSPKEFHCHEPRIMEGPEDVEVKVGKSVVFKCRVTGDPRPEIKWLRNSNEVYLDGDHFAMAEDGSLTISEVTENDAGDYECVAESEMGTTRSRKARALISATTPLRFSVTPSSQTTKFGKDVHLNCEAESNPRARISWWKNGAQITPSGRVTITETTIGGSRLTIFAAKESDSGRYVCAARNNDGFLETSADLEVISRENIPPKLTYRPEDMEAEPGMIIEVPCRADGDPKPFIQWKKDGQSIGSNNFRVSRTGSLFLYNVTVADTGRYECSAINEYGRATAQALVKIRRPGATDALIIRAFNDATISIDQAINRTVLSLLDSKGTKRVDPFRLTRYPDAIGRAAARPAELFERTLVNIRKLVNSGVKANASEFRYEEILTAAQVAEIERLSGCTAHRRISNCSDMCYHSRYRSMDGSCNNLQHPTWGSSYTGFRRIMQPIYENGFSSPVGWEPDRLYYGFPKPAARLVSTTLISTHDVTSDDKLTHMVMQWGQFLDHDLGHALPSVTSESWDGIDCKKSCDNAAPCFPMTVPPGDPRVNNRRCIDFIRTSAVCGSGETSPLWGGLMPREQLNQLTSFIDASQVYGFDDTLGRYLRDQTNDRGLLRHGPTIPGWKPLLPYANGEFVDCRRNPLESTINCFVAGDIRANEQIGLLAMHTIWLREHNRIAHELFALNPQWDGETIYQEARRIVGAQMQHITYNHWIPKIFGAPVEQLIGEYKGYDPGVHAGISNVFTTAALRFGHSLIQPRLERLDAEFKPIPQGSLPLRDAFFAPWRLVDEGGVDPLMRGMFATPAKLKRPDQNLNNELTEQLFKTAHAVALDLAAMNIQRSRDHAIPGYTEWRKFCNMSNAETFDDLAGEISSPTVRRKLSELYGHPGNVDVWVGGILEDQLPGAKVGPLFKCLLLEQFKRLRDGDRFWYENPSSLRPEQLTQIKQTSLARIMCDNGDNITRVQRDVFLMTDEPGEYVSCDEIPRVDLRLWAECCEDCDAQGNSISRFRRSVKEEYSKKKNRDEKGRLHSLAEKKQNCNDTIKILEEEVVTMKQKLDKLTDELKRLKESRNV